MLATLLGCMSCIYYGTVAWLAAALTDSGWSASTAGATLAVISVGAIVSTVVFGALAHRAGGLRDWIVAGMAGMGLALLGVLAAPGLGFAWAALFGIGNGMSFAGSMALPLWLCDVPAGVAWLTGRMLLGGYVVAAAAPPLLGVVRDVTGTYTAGFLGLVVLCALASATAVRVGRRAAATTAG
jgi:CP family cyanate transporter-like MFS transporter